MPIKLTALGLLFNIFQLAIAAAPSEPIDVSIGQVTELTSVVAEDRSNAEVIKTTLTAYSSDPAQTDETPCISASGYDICENPENKNVIAANFLKLGTKVTIPDLFGDKVFTVEDRMHSRFSDRVDILFPDKASAKNFGKRTATIVVYES
jgi:3D (Asp-Asp-Asp) domain-containing protein